jgi:phage tail tape-measure protein
MKLYLKCYNCGQKMNLSVQAATRNNLRYHFGGSNFIATCANCNYRGTYRVQEVTAVSDSAGTAGGATAGGLIGLLGGPLGLVIGGVVGGLLGGANDVEDQRKADVFNESQ